MHQGYTGRDPTGRAPAAIAGFAPEVVVDKIAVERVAREVDATVLRLPMVYGPGDPLRRLQPIVKRIADGRRAIVIPESLAA